VLVLLDIGRGLPSMFTLRSDDGQAGKAIFVVAAVLQGFTHGALIGLRVYRRCQQRQSEKRRVPELDHLPYS